jgi:putative ABC transport system permease protein
VGVAYLEIESDYLHVPRLKGEPPRAGPFEGYGCARANLSKDNESKYRETDSKFNFMAAPIQKLYLRNFKKNPLNLSIGIGGFALGIAAFVVSLLFINNELTFDGFHGNKKFIYRIVLGNDDGTGSAYSSAIIGRTLKENFPEIKLASFSNAGGARIPLRYKDRKFVETRFYFTDPEVFEIFSFPLIEGDAQKCLAAPFSVILTTSAARKYFGEEDPIGKGLKLDWAGTMYDLSVTGILDEIPANSHLQFDFLISNATADLIFTPKSLFTDWTANFWYNYILIPKEVNADIVREKLLTMYHDAVPRDQRSFDVRLQPMERIHLHSRLGAEHSKNNDIMYVYVAASLSVLIITISFINYINILFALYSKRIKELGIRRVLGASSREVGLQLVMESLFNLGIAIALSVVIIFYSAPFFSRLFSTDLSLSALVNNKSIILYSSVGLAIALSLYILQAFSRLRPVSLIENNQSLLASGPVKTIMVGFQIAISLILIVGSIAINRQVRFLEDRDLGFDKNNLVVVPYGRVITDKIVRARSQLLNGSEVLEMALSSQVPPTNLNFKAPCLTEGGNPDGTQDPWNVSLVAVDHGFLSAYGIDVIAGRAFSDEFRNDSTEAFVVNKAFVDALGWTDALGKSVEVTFNPGTGVTQHKKGTIIGVTADFHFESLHKPIVPIVFMYKPSAFFYASFRLTEGNTQTKVEHLKATWNTLFPDTPFEYVFLTQRLESAYKTERSWASSIGIFSGAAILIACLGIYGLISFMIQDRQKEISIRKVLGASGGSIMALLSWRILRIVLIAFFLTGPPCYFLVNNWLGGFAYRITLGTGIFVVALGAFVAITLLVISSNLIKGASVSVVETLRKN